MAAAAAAREKVDELTVEAKQAQNVAVFNLLGTQAMCVYVRAKILELELTLLCV